MSAEWLEQVIRNRNDALVRMQVDIIVASQTGRGKKKTKKPKKDEVSRLLDSMTGNEIIAFLGELDDN